MALELAQQSGTKAQLADSHLSLAKAYDKRGTKDDQFLGRSEHAQRAISLAQQCGNKMAEAESYKILAIIAADRDGNTEQAEVFVQKARSLYQEIGQLHHAAGLQLAHGRALPPGISGP